MNLSDFPYLLIIYEYVILCIMRIIYDNRVPYSDYDKVFRQSYYMLITLRRVCTQFTDVLNESFM